MRIKGEKNRKERREQLVRSCKKSSSQQREMIFCFVRNPVILCIMVPREEGIKKKKRAKEPRGSISSGSRESERGIRGSVALNCARRTRCFCFSHCSARCREIQISAPGSSRRDSRELARVRRSRGRLLTEGFIGVTEGRRIFSGTSDLSS